MRIAFIEEKLALFKLLSRFTIEKTSNTTDWQTFRTQSNSSDACVLSTIASALKGRGRSNKTVSSNAPNSKTRKRIIAEVDDIDVGGTEAEAGEDLAKNSWDTITNVTNDKEGNNDENEEEETIQVNRQDDEEIMMFMIQEGFNDVH
ncbi:hypothetical protein PRIPAC_77466 [Pristionchus pacificus]|uniref:Uncharacterized protein n=1 Tax=Pristionchus pacificus TaxID=54126 RepID=A0A2A6CJM7_PRIPA|nr:hypothetical protein PRIPAC_77466 [Pristionchus pacificus]|eukprot:PDM78221.1 hypothetical protein PRIPAC_30800 [Pristionchus pacificus]